MNPQRAIDIVGGLLVAVVFGLMAYNIFVDPTADDRAWLDAQLKQQEVAAASEAKNENDFVAWQKAIAAKPEVWQALSDPPPAPPPLPPPPCNSPSEDELKKQITEQGIVFTRSQIGQKIKVVIGGDKRGEFYEVGETVKGFTIKSFDRTSVVLETVFKCPDKKEVRQVEVTVARQ